MGEMTRDHSDDLGIDEKIILKLILKINMV
jgi:hypothetical protein